MNAFKINTAVHDPADIQTWERGGPEPSTLSVARFKSSWKHRESICRVILSVFMQALGMRGHPCGTRNCAEWLVSSAATVHIRHMLPTVYETSNSITF